MIRKNIFWNLFGFCLPLLAGILFYPLIISKYGLERFGILTLAWSIVGYFSLFDFGLSRALTQLISERMDESDSRDTINSLINTAFVAMCCLGVLGGLILYFASPYVVDNLLHLSMGLSNETVRGFGVLAVGIPFLVHTAALRGVLESQQRFMIVSLVRTVLGVGTFLAPYAASFYGASLINACYSLVGLRVVVWAIYLMAFNYAGGFSVSLRAVSRVWLSPLFRFGSWMTVTNIISPMMDYLDRFLIVSLLGAATVSYYVAPFEVITKVLVIAAAFAGVLFPLFARHWQADQIGSAKLLGKGITYTLLISYPVIFVVVVFAQEWLSIWLGKDFSVNSVAVVSWLGLGVIVNGVAQLFFAKVQGAGRSDWTAKLHFLELLPYLMMICFGLKVFGIKGAAFAWFFRVLFDLIGLIYFCNKLNRHTLAHVTKPLLAMFLGLLAILMVTEFSDIYIRLALSMMVLFCYALLTIWLIIHDKLFRFMSQFS